ncbi:hypothetical protein HDG35_006615 [Paraburkholderia sp. JPY681]|nr:hypothetical protein [Paraburkholderia atlantica]
MIVDRSAQHAAANYKLLIGSILPRAIAWVSTLSKAPPSEWSATDR